MTYNHLSTIIEIKTNKLTKTKNLVTQIGLEPIVNSLEGYCFIH